MEKATLICLSLFLAVGFALNAHGQTSSAVQHYYNMQQEEPPNPVMIIGDLLIYRPLGAIFTALGVVLTAVSIPVAVPSGSVGTVSQKLVAEPFAFTFTRPLGVFSNDVALP
jgi:hypothetical protein